MTKFFILLISFLLPSSILMAVPKSKRIPKEMLPGEDDWKSWTLEELEKQMSPSQWNPKLTSEQVMSQYVELGTRGTEQSRKELKHKLDVPYGPLPLEKFDVYGIDLPENAPILFWIHGGYWQFPGKELAGNFAQLAYHCGYKTIVMGYTLAPEVGIEKIQQEVEEALKVALTRYPKSHFIVGGHSAGGQLAAGLLFDDANVKVPQLLSQLKGLLLVSGVYDLRPLVNTTINHNLNLTLENAQALSPLFNNIKPTWTRIGLKNCIIVGNFDSPEFKRQTQGYVEQLKGELDVKYWVSLDDDHFSIIENFGEASSEAAKTLKEYLTSVQHAKVL